jgi:hypothetical protein
MKNIGLRNALWRSRAVAIIGFVIILLSIFNGLPSSLKTTLFVVLGLLTLSFGFAGSRHKSYSEPESLSNREIENTLGNEKIFPVVEEDTSADFTRTDAE